MSLTEMLNQVSGDIKKLEKAIATKDLFLDFEFRFLDEEFTSVLLIWKAKEKRIYYVSPKMQKPRRLIECPAKIRLDVYSHLTSFLCEIEGMEKNALNHWQFDLAAKSLHDKLEETQNNNFNR